eukprot:jgi/Mesvir1/28642/Mv15066-RA.1
MAPREAPVTAPGKVAVKKSGPSASTPTNPPASNLAPASQEKASAAKTSTTKTSTTSRSAPAKSVKPRVKSVTKTAPTSSKKAEASAADAAAPTGGKRGLFRWWREAIAGTVVFATLYLLKPVSKRNTAPKYYVVKQGDYLSKLVSDCSNPRSKFYQLNPQVCDRHLIFPGQRLRLN